MDAFQMLYEQAKEAFGDNVVAFVASIPDTKSAIQIGGSDATLKLDISQTADMFGEHAVKQRPAVWLIDSWQEDKRPLLIIAIQTPAEIPPAVQTKMDFDKKPVEPTPDGDAGAKENAKDDEEWPLTTSPAIIHNHFYPNYVPRSDSAEGELAPELMKAIAAGEVRGLPEPAGVIDG